MAHGHTTLDEADKQPIGAKLWPSFGILVAAALAGLVLLLIGSFFADNGKSRFFYAYLIGYTFVLGITVGSVALVILTHLFRAGWVVAVRRVPETFASNFWIVGLLGLPILFAAFDSEDASLYPWSASLEVAQARFEAAEQFLHDREHGHDHHDEEKTAGTVNGGTAEVRRVSDTADAAGHDGEPAAGPTGYEAAKALQAGRAYDGATREENRAIQKAYYDTLLAYMLDYKRYGGQLAGDELVPVKDGKGQGFTWLHPMLFALRLVIYFAILSLIGWYYWTRSIKQDETGDAGLTTRREWWAPLSVVAFALTITFLSFDLLMSLDPGWYSTMFGVIFFANSFTAGIAVTILACMIFQKKGYLKTVNTEHYHDLGKLLFAFVFFWGYVSFSQFMLLWYASFPETVYWLEIHGMTTVQSAPQYGSGWSYIALVMLFGHLLVPFAFLLSRHVKRNLTALAAASVWMLLMVYLDFYWYIMPFFDTLDNKVGVTFGLPEIGAALMLVSAVLAAFVYKFRQHAPLAHGDPRLSESTALDTNVWAPIHH